MLIVFFLYGYIVFEIDRLYGGRMSPFQDWRSYLAFLASKIPFLRERVRYQPMKIATPSEQFSEIFQRYIEIYNQKIEELTRKEEEMKREQDVVNAQKKVLEQTLKELETLRNELMVEKNKIQSYQKQLKELIDVLLSTDPRNLASALNQLDEETLAAVFKNMDPTNAGEFLEALSRVNAEKAANVMRKMIGVREIQQRMEELIENAKKSLEEVVKREQSIFLRENYLKVVAAVLNELEPTSAVDFLKREGFDSNTVRTVLSLMDRVKAQALLKYIQERNPELLGEKR